MINQHHRRQQCPPQAAPPPARSRHWCIAVLMAGAVALGGCDQAAQKPSLQQQLDQAQAELKRAQEGQRAAERELADVRKAAENTRYVDDGPSLAPDEPSPPGDPETPAPGDAASEAPTDAPAP